VQEWMRKSVNGGKGKWKLETGDERPETGRDRVESQKVEESIRSKVD
jgi:hypothetical protein